MERVRTLHGPELGHVVVGAGGDGIVGVDHARNIAESGHSPLRSKGFSCSSQLHPRKVERFNPLRRGGLAGHYCSIYVPVSPTHDSEHKCLSISSTAPLGPSTKPTSISAGFAGPDMRLPRVKRSCWISARFSRPRHLELRAGRTSTSTPSASFGRLCAKAVCTRKGACPTIAILSSRIGMRGNGFFTRVSWSGSHQNTGSAACCIWMMVVCQSGWNCRTANISTSRSRGSWLRLSGPCLRRSRSNPRNIPRPISSWSSGRSQRTGSMIGISRRKWRWLPGLRISMSKVNRCRGTWPMPWQRSSASGGVFSPRQDQWAFRG